ncbi:hypothetical protein IL38_23740 [Actinopolyspora erythraea]|uniref:Immunity protein Imm1 n=1 Tax=Actinopolyspora erythraea TaxID=414996 RepID=A0ABR4WY67_9ACTN|nr:Imm1 family immunity protein [Actinopolyspora erythraea]KGI79325.1 hypothetical protein IL38_23740 [Actinopolyspora erythraea]
MTLAAEDVEVLKRELSADLVTLREVDDLVSLLRPSPEDEVGRVWNFGYERELSGPGLVFGINGTVGFVYWYDGESKFVPEGTRYRGQDITYATATGWDFACDSGEEIPVEYVYAAALEFVATGERPKVIRWVTPPEPPERERSEQEQELWRIVAQINAET